MNDPTMLAQQSRFGWQAHSGTDLPWQNVGLASFHPLSDQGHSRDQHVWKKEAQSHSLLQVHLEPCRLKIGAAGVTDYPLAFLF